MIDADAELVRRTQSGDTLAMHDPADRLSGYVGRICGLRKLQQPAGLYGWVRTIAVREAVRAARLDARAVPAQSSELPARGDPQLAADVRDLLARLSPEPRAILVLRDIEGPGWCWLHSRFLLIGMAAAPELSGGTRVALTGGVRVPGRAAIVPLGTVREARQALDRPARL